MDSHPYTCISCSLAFSSAATQRTHYSTDLHRYNAQRKIANLPPITAESFNQKVLERRKENTPSQTGPEKLYCDACRKNFASGNAYENHLNSRKHKEALANPVAPREKMTVDSPTDTTGQTEPIKLSSQSTALLESAANDPSADAAALKKHLERSVQQAHFIPPLQCLFCTQTLPDLTAKVKHMHASHGFFIPDREYLVDEAGLVAYLAEVLSIWNACIYCGAAFAPPEPTPAADTEFSSEEEQLAEAKKRSRRALEAVRNHMSSKNHCKLPWDSEDERLEYSDFYDFTKSYEDDEENAGWEDVDGDGDEEHADMVVEDDDSSSTRANGKIMYGDTPFELVLPSGKRIGHRALRHIYKQNLIPSIKREDVQLLRLTKHLGPTQSPSNNASSSNALVRSNLDQMVLAGKLTQSAAKKASRPEKSTAAQEQFRTKVGIKHNNQKHFRQELLQ